MSFRLRTLPIVHDWVSQVVQPAEVVIDATVGNGHDTLFLSRLVGEEGRVYGFDIQQEAVERTRAMLEQEGEQQGVELFAKCHSEIKTHVAQEVAAVMFNLGYLPKGDKSIITEQETTLQALEQCLDLLRPQGVITIMCYPGHEGGASESNAVDAWARALESPQYLVMRMAPHNTQKAAPYLLMIQRNL